MIVPMCDMIDYIVSCYHNGLYLNKLTNFAILMKIASILFIII